ncbi:hypothetical protein B0J12DRAFT_213311 [Macrophomina phaseolina]|uniref:Uncharacterized protein n=1 Tax=Macrophomina phaseolina TaxID=35725 RepID=A0ABQ8G1C6_9PEZI|nr:hypothetical protein B0J12DRAFT_213311 [Macrophomina phaseolina]
MPALISRTHAWNEWQMLQPSDRIGRCHASTADGHDRGLCRGPYWRCLCQAGHLAVAGLLCPWLQVGILKTSWWFGDSRSRLATEEASFGRSSVRDHRHEVDRKPSSRQALAAAGRRSGVHSGSRSQSAAGAGRNMATIRASSTWIRGSGGRTRMDARVTG